MIKVMPQPEPVDFSLKVKEPGLQFLAKNSKPSSKDWKNREYWQRILEDMYEAYGGICAYCAEWMPLTTGDPTVDHYIPKSIDPQLAYN